MATRKKKKKPPGKQAGRPALSEPRVQVFSKFAGCNFQLAQRDFDDLFDTDQDAQTDLMPTLMAIQNNAAIAPLGGIETRQNLVPLFSAPNGKRLTGVATLIGNELYAACDDMTVHHGSLPAGGVGNLSSGVTITDQNSTYGEPTEYSVTASEVADPPDVVAESHATGPGIGAITLGGPFLQSFPASPTHKGFTTKLKNLQNAERDVTATLYPNDSFVAIATSTVAMPALHDGEVAFTWSEDLTPGTYRVVVDIDDQNYDQVQVYHDPSAAYALGAGWGNTSGFGWEAPPAIPAEWTEDDTIGRITYDGGYKVANAVHYNGSTHFWSAVGSATIKWFGTRLQIFGTRGEAYGIAAVSVDGGAPVSVDCYGSLAYQYQLYDTGALAFGWHTLTWAWTGTKNASAVGTDITLDALHVHSQPVDWYFKSAEEAPYSYTAEHTVIAEGMLSRVRFTGLSGPAHISLYHGTSAGELIYEADVAGDTDITLSPMHEIAVDDTVTLVVDSAIPVAATLTVWFSEAIENNIWTFLGYADDRLVGMTANLQLWTGILGDYELENALVVPDPLAALPYACLTAMGSLTISATETATEVFRVSLLYTLLNKYGPTLPSPALTFWASKPVIEWSTAAYVAISSPDSAPNGTAPEHYHLTGVELYFTEGEYQEPNFLARIDLAADAPDDDPPHPDYKPWTYNWTGYLYDSAMWLVANLTLPTQNHTAGVPASQMAAIDGRLYFWGGDPAYRIWVGGNPGNRFSVSPGTGGGFVDVEPGVGTVVTDVLKFKTQQGASIVTALCDNENSHKEYRFNLVETNISLSNEQSTKAWQAEKVPGTVGCKSTRGALAAGDGLYAVSRYGLAITTLTMEYNSQLQVMYVSDPIAPVFLKQYGNQLEAAVLFEVDGVLYMTFGTPDGTLDNVIFCYDIALKAWWTYTLDTDVPILNMIHIDHEDTREGIGIITATGVWLLPTTRDEALTVLPGHEVLIESGEISTVQPLQAMHHLSQLEFRFDYFIGDLDIVVTMIDQFGREIEVRKSISHATVQHQLSEYIRIDQVVESYKIVMSGAAKMRLTHYIAKLYPKPMRIGMVWGFDSSQSHAAGAGLIRRTFSSYNDLREAIIP